MTDEYSYQTDTSDMLIPHNLFRGAFASAPDVIGGVSPGAAEHAAVVNSYFDNILRFLDAHHGGEDAIIWPLLIERCPADVAVVSRMEGQHDAIHELRDRAETALGAWTDEPSQASGEKLAGALTSLQAELDVHFGEEEREILPLASKYLSPEEWAALPGHAMGHFTGDKIWLILGLILEQMTSEERAMTLKLLPPPAVDMWTNMGETAFQDFITRVRQPDGSPATA